MLDFNTVFFSLEVYMGNDFSTLAVQTDECKLLSSWVLTEDNSKDDSSQKQTDSVYLKLLSIIYSVLIFLELTVQQIFALFIVSKI